MVKRAGSSEAVAVKVNDETICDEWRLLTLENLTPERVIKLSLGKKRHALLKIKED